MSKLALVLYRALLRQARSIGNERRLVIQEPVDLEAFQQHPPFRWHPSREGMLRCRSPLLAWVCRTAIERLQTSS